MSKKLWNKFFKTKSNKNSKIFANKVQKRCSIYDEYQQLNGFIDENKSDVKINESSETEILDKNMNLENQNNIDQELQSDLSAKLVGNNLSAHSKHQSTFSKVVNTLTLKRNTQQQYNNQKKDINFDNGNRSLAKSFKKQKPKQQEKCKSESTEYDDVVDKVSKPTTPETTSNNNNRNFNYSQSNNINRQNIDKSGKGKNTYLEDGLIKTSMIAGIIVLKRKC